MVDKITQEDLENAEAIAEALTKAEKTKESLLELTIKQEGVERKIKDLLFEEMGKQSEFLTQVEIELDLANRRATALNLQLEAVKELEEASLAILEIDSELTDLAKEREEIEKELAKKEEDLNDAKTANNRERIKEIKKEQAALTRKYDNVLDSEDELAEKRETLEKTEKAISSLNLGTSQGLKDQIQSNNQLVATGKIRAAAINDVAATTDNTLASTLGIRDASSTLTDHFIDAAFGAKKFKDVIDGINKSVEKTMTLQNALKGIAGAAKALVGKALSMLNPLGTIKDLIVDLANTEATFVKATGFANKFGKELFELKAIKSEFLVSEIENAFKSLIETSVKFTTFDKNVRKNLTETAATLNRLGVDTATFANTLDGLVNTLGITGREVQEVTMEVTAFARAIGVSANQALANLNKQMDILATYGMSRGLQIFKELQLNAKATGIEIEKLIGIGNKFDTFDSAMESAGKLNFILGGPFVNSMEMLNATEEKRIQLIRDSVANAGMAFEDLDRFGRQALAKTLGVGEATAAALFQDKNIKTLKEAKAAATADEVEKEDDLLAVTKDLLTVQEKMVRMQQQMAKSMTVMGKSIKDAALALQSFNMEGDESMGWFSTFATVAGGFALGGGFKMLKNLPGLLRKIPGLGRLLGSPTTTAAGGGMLTKALGATKDFVRGPLANVASKTGNVVKSAGTRLLGAATTGATGAVLGGAALGTGIGMGVNYLLTDEKAKGLRKHTEDEGFYEADENPVSEAYGYIARQFGFAEGKKFGEPAPPGGVGITGEVGPELMADFSRGIFRVLGLKGPEAVNITPTTEIFPTQQTADMLSPIEGFANTVQGLFDMVTNATQANTQVVAQPPVAQAPIQVNISLEMDGQVFGRTVETISVETLNRAFGN